MLDSKTPQGPLADKWTNHKNNIRLVNPANKRLIDVIVVGTGLAEAAPLRRLLAEMGYNVKVLASKTAPRRAHSIAAQGGHQRRQELPERRGLGLPLVSTTPSKVATTAAANPTCTAWLEK